DEAAGVEDPPRVELFLYTTHQPAIGNFVPHRHRALPRGRTVPYRHAPLTAPRLFAPYAAQLGGTGFGEPITPVPPHDAAARVHLERRAIRLQVHRPAEACHRRRQHVGLEAECRAAANRIRQGIRQWLGGEADLGVQTRHRADLMDELLDLPAERFLIPFEPNHKG